MESIPGCPRIALAYALQWWLGVLDVETVEVPNKLFGPRANLVGRMASGGLLEGCADLSDTGKAVAGAGKKRHAKARPTHRQVLQENLA